MQKIEKYESDEFDMSILYDLKMSFVEKKIGHIRHEKEYNVIKFITKNMSEYKWEINKSMETESGNFSPDLRMDLDDRIIFIEIDEKQHDKYSTFAETNRILKICNESYSKYVFFIRFNPDEFINNNISIPSCWDCNENKTFYIKDKKQWDFRLDKLKETIKECITCECKENIELIYLFYDKESSKIKDVSENGIKCTNVLQTHENKNNELMNAYADRTKTYKFLVNNDVSLLKIGYCIAYINLEDGLFKKGGRISEIKKYNGYYLIKFTSGIRTYSLKSNKSIIYYREKTMKEVNDEKREIWKAEQMNKNKLTHAQEILRLWDQLPVLRTDIIHDTDKYFENPDLPDAMRFFKHNDLINQICDIISENYDPSNTHEISDDIDKYISYVRNGIYPVYEWCEIEMEIFSDIKDGNFENACKDNEFQLTYHYGNGGSPHTYEHVCNKIKFFKDAGFDFRKCKVRYVDNDGKVI